MTKKQGKKIDMYALIVLFFVKFEGDFLTDIPLVTQITDFKVKEKLIRALLDAQGYGSKPKTRSKAALRQMMIVAIMKLVRKGNAWALTTKDAGMMEIFGIVEEDFKLSQDKLIVLVDKILDILTKNIVALTPYKVTLLTIGAVKTIEADYLEAKDAPKQQQESKKTITTTLENEIDAADLILEICDNLIIAEYEDSLPALVIEYNNDRKVVNSVSRHTAIRAHVYGDEDHTELIVGASIGIASLKRNELTDIDAMGEIIQFKGGDYVLDVKAVGYADAAVPFSIKKGKHLEIDVVLVPNVLEVYMTDAKGLPAGDVAVSIANTTISAATNAQGIALMYAVPEGNGIAEGSDINGNASSKGFLMVNGKRLRIEMQLG